MSNQLQAVLQSDFSKGENLVSSPYVLGRRYSLRVVNLILDEHGALRTVDGTKIISSAPLAEVGNRILLPMYWKPVGASAKSLVIVQSGATNKLYDYATSPWTLRGTFTTNQPDPEAVIFGNFLITTDGYNTPKKLQSDNTFAALGGGLGGAKHLREYLSYVWAGNTAAATTGTDGPSVLRSSDLNLPETWPVANVAFISKDDGDEVRGLGRFTIAEAGISPASVLVVFKDHSAYQVSGAFGAQTIQRIKTDMGCIAPRSIQFVSGFGLIRFTHRGFALYDGVGDKLISEEIRPRLFGRDDVTGIQMGNVDLAWAGQIQNPPIYFCFMPTTGAGMTRAFLYDLIRSAWTTVDLPFAVSSANLILQAGTLPQLLLTDTTAGNIRQWFAGDLDFDGTAVSWSYRSRPAFLRSPLQPAFFRRVMLDVLAPTGATINFNLIFSGNTQVTGAHVETFQPLAAGGIWGQSLWGQFTWGAGALPLVGDQVPIEVMTKATNAILELTGTGPMRLRAVEWHIRRQQLRSNRR